LPVLDALARGTADAEVAPAAAAEGAAVVVASTIGAGPAPVF
jgi:hypothetical protein